MADIRINALATTAASTASDDFVAVDGSANGTRKLNAFSPTFGGNLTVSGATTVKGQISSVTNSTLIVDYVTGGDYGRLLSPNSAGNYTTPIQIVNGLTVGGNLTVSGTGTSSVAGVFKAGTDIVTGDTSAFQVHNNVDDKPMVGFYRGGTLRSVLRLNTDNDFRLLSSDLSTLANLIVGNLLIGTTTDGGQKLQVSGTAYVSGNATFAGSIAIGNTVQTAVAVASTHKVTISIGGTTYYLLATNV